MATREELKKVVAKGIVKRSELVKTPSLLLCDELLEIAMEVKRIGLSLTHRHGILLGEELSIRVAYERMALEENDVDETRVSELERRLSTAVKEAEFLGDIDLLLRLYQTQFDFYSQCNDLMNMIETMYKANSVYRDSTKTVKLVELFFKYIRILNSIRPKEDQEKMIGDKMTDANCRCMIELQSLRQNNDFNYQEFVNKNFNMMYQVFTYIAVMFTDHLIYDLDSEEQKIGKTAFELALEVATMVNEADLICACWGHRVNAYFGRSSEKEKEEMIKHLKFLKEKYKPKDTTIDETLQAIDTGKHIRLKNSDIGVEEDLDHESTIK
ncbi:hypothetical protein EIN_083080 [Entamoeba invadens IP1]|uniref:hypothetical protein n=1 Tax=Entamoeba invadens IP1 TaxID=370355 RepID=UPI0002C3EC96|nr:hypothetical protein EIN_083080 [Entamoeba invadens IP1]ELP85196.1 hypothetical protein EIN_083080 [Entamoeba invadens IP1]|eukprot:XP_004184542.1 hypothetical protein EIN_083080 [Entamoeba invadens IP1]